MSREDVKNRLKNIKKTKEESQPVIQEIKQVAKKGRKKGKKEGFEYTRVVTDIRDDLNLEILILQKKHKISRIEIIEQALEKYLPEIKKELDK